MKLLLSIFTTCLLIASSGNVIAATKTVFGNLHCDSNLKHKLNFGPETKLITQHHFKAGDALILAGSSDANTPLASADMCMVKLITTPGLNSKNNASISAGIGIEVWLPTYEKWNKRLHAEGGGGYAGGHASSPDKFSLAYMKLWDIAGSEGAVAVHSDFGQQGEGFDGTFLANVDGSPNKLSWQNFSHVGVFEMAQKAKYIAQAFYGEPVKFSYFRGGSTGGRQGLKISQLYPDLFDGIIADFPAINWTQFITSELYPQIAYMQELGGHAIPKELLDLASNSAIQFCSAQEGHNLGYLLRPDQCNYDATKDTSIICSNGQQGSLCLTSAQAKVINQIWYGQTRDGRFPAPQKSIGHKVAFEKNQLWYGLLRGSKLEALAGENAFPIASTQVALQLQSLDFVEPFIAPKVGQGKWRTLNYQQLAQAYDEGTRLQESFAEINTNNTDLEKFKAAGGKMITLHGLADELITAKGTVRYYSQLIDKFGSEKAVQDFYHLYLVPGMSHNYDNGTTNPLAKPAIPSVNFMYKILTQWVENGKAPEEFSIETDSGIEMPICLFPARTYSTQSVNGGPTNFTCK